MATPFDPRRAFFSIAWTPRRCRDNYDGNTPVKDHHQKLGSAGLSLHYANIINQIQIDDTLLTVPQIKAEMEKMLQWLVPMSTNTTKYEMNRQPTGPTDLLRIETLHHADKEKTEAYILDLVVWLHHLISQSRSANDGLRSFVKSPIRSPNQKMLQLSCHKPSSPLSVEDQEILRDVSKWKLTPGISKSQDFDTSKTRICKHHRLSTSSSHSPTSENKRDPFPIRRPSSVPIINFDIDWIKALDVIDRVDTI